MTPEEVDAFLAGRHTMTLSTIGPGGLIHSVAMWYAWLDGRIYVESKVKAQKVVNLRRDPRLTAMVESGDSYLTLKGVQIAGRGRIHTDRALFERVGADMFQRYLAGSSERTGPNIENLVRKRVVVELVPERVVSWDHAKLPASAGLV